MKELYMISIINRTQEIECISRIKEYTFDNINNELKIKGITDIRTIKIFKREIDADSRCIRKILIVGDEKIEIIGGLKKILINNVKHISNIDIDIYNTTDECKAINNYVKINGQWNDVTKINRYIELTELIKVDEQTANILQMMI